MVVKTNTGFIQDSNLDLNTSLFNTYLGSKSKWLNSNFFKKLNTLEHSTSPSGRPPLFSTNSFKTDLDYDKSPRYSDNEMPALMGGKEESSPTYLFDTY